jgi:hypothetical protein
VRAWASFEGVAQRLLVAGWLSSGVRKRLLLLLLLGSFGTCKTFGACLCKLGR